MNDSNAVKRTNEFGQPIGHDLGEWSSPEFPPSTTHQGRTVALEPLSAALHAEALLSVFDTVEDSLWTYLPFGPFDSLEALTALIDNLVARPDWLPFAVAVDGTTIGFLSYLRVEPTSGTFEIGSIVFGPGLSRTTAATEALFLLLDHGFELGYRRGEWKCDALNEPSREAAERLGFVYEGTFANATHYKGRNRDTAWFGITSERWPELRAAFVAWLDADNFDEVGRQRRPLGSFRPSS